MDELKYDVIGDVHGCYDELKQLLKKLGYQKEHNTYTHKDHRTPVFVGDITDRGPNSLRVIQLVYDLVVVHNSALYVPGNHCDKLYRYFLGNAVQLKHGLETTVEEYKALSPKEQKSIRHCFMKLYEQAPLYLLLPDVEAIIAHAGIKESLIGKTGKKVKSFVLYGDTTGEFHPDGRPIRRDWAKYYHGEKWIIYGHTPVYEPRFKNHTVNIDTGCVFGNKLTACQLPELKVVTVPSNQPFQATKFTTFES